MEITCPETGMDGEALIMSSDILSMTAFTSRIIEAPVWSCPLVAYLSTMTRSSCPRLAPAGHWPVPGDAKSMPS